MQRKKCINITEEKKENNRNKDTFIPITIVIFNAGLIDADLNISMKGGKP